MSCITIYRILFYLKKKTKKQQPRIPIGREKNEQMKRTSTLNEKITLESLHYTIVIIIFYITLYFEESSTKTKKVEKENIDKKCTFKMNLRHLDSQIIPSTKGKLKPEERSETQGKNNEK